MVCSKWERKSAHILWCLKYAIAIDLISCCSLTTRYVCMCVSVIWQFRTRSALVVPLPLFGHVQRSARSILYLLIPTVPTRYCLEFCSVLSCSFLRIILASNYIPNRKTHRIRSAQNVMGIVNLHGILLVCAIFFICLLCYLQLTTTNFGISSLITCVHCLNWLKRENESQCRKRRPEEESYHAKSAWNEHESKQLKSNRDEKSQWIKVHVQKKENRRCWLKRDDWNLNFLPAGLRFAHFIKATSKWPSIQQTQCTQTKMVKSNRTRDTAWNKESQLDQLENIRRNDEHLGKWCLWKWKKIKSNKEKTSCGCANTDENVGLVQTYEGKREQKKRSTSEFLAQLHSSDKRVVTLHLHILWKMKVSFILRSDDRFFVHQTFWVNFCTLRHFYWYGGRQRRFECIHTSQCVHLKRMSWFWGEWENKRNAYTHIFWPNAPFICF